jgi:uncharacterized LabA/DUF88 family protein
MTLREKVIEPADFIERGTRVAFFINADQAGSMARSLGFRIDWPRALSFFLGNGTFADAYYYFIDQANPRERERGVALAAAGMTLRPKPLKIIHDPTTRRDLVKANVNADIVLDMLTQIGTYDAAFLFSGDGDLARVVDALRVRGRRVYVVSVREFLAYELMHAASKPLQILDDLSPMIAQRQEETS